MKSLLLVEDDPIMGESLAQRFQLEGFQVSWQRRLAEALPCIERHWAAIISDVRLPDGLATEWFVTLPSAVRMRPWFFLTGYGTVDDAVTAIRAGAREYLTKPFDIERLVELVSNAIRPDVAIQDEAVLGVSAAMSRVEAMIRKVARQAVSVLLTGESGVGKEVAAQLIHDQDVREPRGEFVAVNCAAVPEAMMEAEFFGYERGAFSGAQRQHRGYLERANGGTLFLDEVGELPPAMQAKLLRALQERSFYRLGSEKLTRSEFRLISATNRDLYAAMSAGAFREDLFYRIGVIRINLPPLRERLEDVRWLAERMLREIVGKQGKPLAISERFYRSLLVNQWRGNARELRSHLEQAVVLSDSGILDCPDIDDAPAADGLGNVEIVPLQRFVEETERQHIRRALVNCDQSVSCTAKLLGISRKTLWEKMKRLDISTSER